MRALTLLALGLIAWVSYSVASAKSRASPTAAAGDTLTDDEDLLSGQELPSKSNGSGDKREDPAHLRVRWCVRVPESTPVDASIYVSGSHPGLGSWSPRGLPLVLESPSVYCGELEVAAGSVLEYKFTRGSWAAVEAGPGGVQRPNRALTVLAPEVVQAEIETWCDRN